MCGANLVDFLDVAADGIRMENGAGVADRILWRVIWERWRCWWWRDLCTDVDIDHRV